MLALLMATVGIYGVVSFVVSRRLREMGIRMMLGAGIGNIRTLIARQTLRPVAIEIIGPVSMAASTRSADIARSASMSGARLPPPPPM